MTNMDALRALAQKFGVPGVDLNEVVILVTDLDLIPREVCEAHGILPIAVRGEQVFLAMANPHDRRVIDEIEFVTGKKVYPYAAIPHDLSRAVEAAHDAKNRRVIYYLGPSVSDGRAQQLGVDAKGVPIAGLVQAPTVTSLSGLAASIGAPLVTPMIPPSMRHSEPADDEELTIDRSSSIDVVVDAGPDSAIRGSAGRRVDDSARVILVVDDEEDIRKMVKRVLESKGHTVLEAENGAAALHMVKQHTPDLLVLDAMLPGLHGFDVARRLRASELYEAIPIIMISAVYRGWRVAEDLKASYGIRDYLEKPFRLADVVDAVTRALAPGPAAEAPAGPPPDLDILSADAAKALDDGIAAYRAGDVDKAIALLQHGTRIDPLAYRLHFHLALLYGKKDQVFDGIGELEVAIELNPKHFPALKNLALLYERAGFKNRAVEMWERCVHAAPDAVSRAQVKERLLHLL